MENRKPKTQNPSNYLQRRESSVKTFDDFPGSFEVGAVDFQVNSAEGVGVEWENPDAHLIKEVVANVFLFEQELEDREFVGVGEDGQSMKILHGSFIYS